MIVPMKHVDIVCLLSDRAQTLEALREAGVVHLDLAAACGAGVQSVRAAVSEAERAVRLVIKARGKTPRDQFEIRPHTVAEILAIATDRETLEAAANDLERDIRLYAPYGDFDPVLAAELLAKVPDLRETVDLPAELPKMRLSRLREKLARVRNRIEIDTARLAGCDEQAVLAHYPTLADRLAFEAALELMNAQGEVCVLTGWIPVPRVDALLSLAHAQGWGLLLRDPQAGEEPPSLVEPPKFFKSVKVLFQGLGIAPAYVESDVSVPFFCYFSLFFAMLVGDGAYGTILLLATLWGWKKFLAAPKGNPILRSWLVMLTVFSLATIVWGVLSNTWFGAALPFARHWPTVEWLGDPTYNNMMLLCFTIGASHLMLARLWNGICLLPDSTSIAQFGWAGILLTMYFVTNAIVGIFPTFPRPMFYVAGVSLVAVFGFTVKPRDLKAHGAELGMLPLNIMSALGDIISYVRLFAVGLASVKVAQNFNQMAVGLVADAESWYTRLLCVLAMAAIMILGHGLNLVMAALSILVHAVRLNTLEFSNHKGVSWAGYAFKPFRRTT